MSVSIYFGYTKSGKSYHVENHILPLWNRSIIFDVASCFSGEAIVDPSDEKLKELLRKYSTKEKYRLVIRPGRNSDYKTLFDKSVLLACSLGRLLKTTDQPIQFVGDEADFVCSSQFQSAQMKHLVNKGRHDMVDSHFIARLPMRLHTDIRANASKIVTFKLTNANDVPLFKDIFGRPLTKKIPTLPKFCRLEWNTEGEISAFNQKNKKFEVNP